MLFDATDIDSGDGMSACYAYDDTVDSVLLAVGNAPNAAGISMSHAVRQALRALVESR